MSMEGRGEEMVRVERAVGRGGGGAMLLETSETRRGRSRERRAPNDPRRRHRSPPAEPRRAFPLQIAGVAVGVENAEMQDSRRESGVRGGAEWQGRSRTRQSAAAAKKALDDAAEYLVTRRSSSPRTRPSRGSFAGVDEGAAAATERVESGMLSPCSSPNSSPVEGHASAACSESASVASNGKPPSSLAVASLVSPEKRKTSRSVVAQKRRFFVAGLRVSQPRVRSLSTSISSPRTVMF